jgi:hypothetical protein
MRDDRKRKKTKKRPTTRLLRRAVIGELVHFPRPSSAEPGTRGTLTFVDGATVPFEIPRMLMPQLFLRVPLLAELEVRGEGERRVIDLALLRDARDAGEIVDQAQSNGLLSGVDEASWARLVAAALGGEASSLTPEEAVEVFALHYGRGATPSALADGVLFGPPVDDPPDDGWSADDVCRAFEQLTGLTVAREPPDGDGEDGEGACEIFVQEEEPIDLTGTLGPFVDYLNEQLAAVGREERLFMLAARSRIEAFARRTRLSGGFPLFRDATK